jgi:hypothetical protein
VNGRIWGGSLTSPPPQMLHARQMEPYASRLPCPRNLTTLTSSIYLCSTPDDAISLYLCTPAEADASESMADEEALYCSEEFLHVVGRRHHHRSGGFPITKASESDQFAWQIEQHPILFALHPPNVLRSR